MQVFCEQSDLSLDDIIGDAENREELERQIESGDLMIADIMVHIHALGLVGFDSLGSCYITKPEDVAMYVHDNQLKGLAIEHLDTVARQTFNELNKVYGVQNEK